MKVAFRIVVRFVALFFISSKNVVLILYGTVNYMIVIIIRYDIGHILEFYRFRKLNFMKNLGLYHLKW